VRRRAGVGRALVAAVEAWAAEQGCRELCLRKPLAAPAARAATPLLRGNLRAGIPETLGGELVTALVASGGARLQRIVSRGHVTPAGSWYDQDEDEWVLVVAGAARLEIEGRGEIALADGDWIELPRGLRHRVTHTAPDRDTIWLALFRR
jgi:cupin 2 domain-containing protein